MNYKTMTKKIILFILVITAVSSILTIAYVLSPKKNKVSSTAGLVEPKLDNINVTIVNHTDDELTITTYNTLYVKGGESGTGTVSSGALRIWKRDNSKFGDYLYYATSPEDGIAIDTYCDENLLHYKVLKQCTIHVYKTPVSPQYEFNLSYDWGNITKVRLSPLDYSDTKKLEFLVNGNWTDNLVQNENVTYNLNLLIQRRRHIPRSIESLDKLYKIICRRHFDQSRILRLEKYNMRFLSTLRRQDRLGFHSI